MKRQVLKINFLEFYQIHVISLCGFIVLACAVCFFRLPLRNFVQVAFLISFWGDLIC